MHPSDAILLALIHGEPDDRTAAHARAHLASCAECAGRSAALAKAETEVGALLSLLDHPVPFHPMPVSQPARPRWARPAVAASLALLLAGAAAAAVPATALHRWIAARLGAAPVTAAAPAAPAPPPAHGQEGGVELPGTGALTVTFAVPEPAGRLTVSAGARRGAVLHAFGGDVGYQVGRGRIAVDNRRPAGRYSLEVPADLAHLTVLVAGRPVFDSERRALDAVPDTVSPLPGAHAMSRWVLPAALAAVCAVAPGARAQAPVGVALAGAIPRSPDSTVLAGLLAQIPDTTVLAGARAQVSDSVVPAGPRLAALAPSFAGSSTSTPADTGERRPRAVEYSDAYYTRLTIHRYASYAELPLFAVEYALGQQILNGEQTGDFASEGTRSAHRVVAGALGALFVVNTVTGVWNLVEARKDPVGRTRRNLHALGMLLADAGFLYTASLAGDAKESVDAANQHRNAALASIGVATASTLMMWLWRD